MKKKVIPKDIYTQTVSIAKSYYIMINRNKAALANSTTIENSTAQKRNREKIQAVEQAWNRIADDTARQFIQKNIFEGCPMKHILLPLSISTMKRIRSNFITYVAEELGDI